MENSQSGNCGCIRSLRKRLFRAYQSTLIRLGGHGFGRFSWVRKLDVFVRMRLKRRTANILGHHMALDDLDTLNLSLEGIHEPLATEVLVALTSSGDVVLDVGANIGYFTLLFARQAGPTGRVFAYEPEPVNFKLLARNLELNCYKDRVVAYQKAASDEPGLAALAVVERNRGMNRLWKGPSGSTSIEVEKVVLDDNPLLFERPINLVKIDVEGWELHVLSGMKRLLKCNPQVAIFTEFTPSYLVEAGSIPVQLIELLAGQGRQLFILKDGSKKLCRVKSSHWQHWFECEYGGLSGAQINILSVSADSDTRRLPIE